MENRLMTKEDVNRSPDYHDTVFDGCMFVPVFCTAEIPPSTIDDLLSSSRPPIQAVGGGVAFAILSDKCIDPTKEIIGAAREPTQPFQSPFLGHTLDEIYAAFAGTSPGGLDRTGHACWSRHTFLVLDATTLDATTLSTALVATDISGILETIRSDLPTTLRLAVCLESEDMSILYAQARLVDANGIVTHELWETWSLMDNELTEVEVDEHGELWVELVDVNGKRLGVVRKQEEGGKKFARWRPKEAVEGGLKAYH